MYKQKVILFFSVVTLFITGCGVKQSQKKTPVPTPVLSTFTIPPSANALSINGIVLKATADKGGIAGYFLSESSITPLSTSVGWTNIAPTTYKFSTDGTKTLYAWVKNSKGVISNALSAIVVISIADTIVPVAGTSIAFSQLSSSSVLLKWGSASDNITNASSLAYKVVYSTSNNLNSVSSAENFGTTSLNWTPNTTARTVNGLNNETNYYFAVIVKDASGNKTLYPSKAKATLEGVPPVVTVFTLPATSTALKVLVNSLNATDTSGISSYCLSEASDSTSCTWTAIPPTSYTFSDIGLKSIYAWAKDNAGNISLGVKGDTTIVITDTIAPIPTGAITTASITATGLTLNWPVATDNITESSTLFYKVVRSSTNNIATVAGATSFGTIIQDWSQNLTTKIVTELSGATTYYFAVLVRDTTGNQGIYTITTATTLDGTAPTVSLFKMASTSTSLTVPVINFTAADNVGVLGYCITEVDSSAGCSWSSTVPTIFKFVTGGLKTAYAWARDPALNVSQSVSFVVNVSNSVELAWDANPETNIGGYKLHYGTSARNYTQTVNVGKVTTGVIEGLTKGVIYYFAVNAYNTNGLESDYSDEVNYLVP